MAAPKYPCYRLDPHTLQRIEIVEEYFNSQEVEMVDPEFETLYALDEVDIIQNIVPQKEMEM